MEFRNLTPHPVAITIEAARAAGRVTNDLLFPSGFAKRDANGQIIGVSALAQAR